MSFKNYKFSLALGIVIIAICIGELNIVYAIPPKINYQGYLTDINGIPLNQTIDMTFKIYNQLAEGAVLWQEEHKAVAIEDGIFKAYLGEISPITEDLFIADRFIGVTLGEEPEMQPRSQFTSAPYAFIAAKAMSVFDNSIHSETIASQAVITEKIADRAVTTSKIADGSITNSKISEHTIDITKLNFTPLMQEVDPQVGEMNVNDVPKWNGNALVSGSIIDSGENVGISTNDPKETLDVNGALKIGNTVKENPGSIRWTGEDFEGFNETEWVSLTKKSNDINGTVFTAIAGESISGAAAPVPVYIRKDGLIIEQNDGDSKADVYSINKSAQKFITDSGTLNIHKISLKLEKFGNPLGNVDVSINAINDNKSPSTTTIAEVSITATEIINGWNDFAFEPIASVTSSTEYAIVVTNKNGDVNNHIKWMYLDSNNYKAGCCLKSENYGVSWTEKIDKDFAFRIYSDNRIYKSKGEDVNAINTIGFAISNASVGEEVLVQTSGIVDGFEELKIGKRYYIKDLICGIDILVGSFNKSIGIAVSDSKLQIFDIANSGINWKGSWQININYKEFDAVEYDGESFICNTNHKSSSDNYPSINNVWEILANKGEKGDRGEKGLKGDRGEKGLKGDPGSNSSTISIGPSGCILLYEKHVYTDSENLGITLKDDESNSFEVVINNGSNKLQTYGLYFCYKINCLPSINPFKAGKFKVIKDGVCIAYKYIYTCDSRNDPKYNTSINIPNLKNGDKIEFKFERVATIYTPYELKIYTASIKLYMNIIF